MLICWTFADVSQFWIRVQKMQTLLAAKLSAYHNTWLNRETSLETWGKNQCTHQQRHFITFWFTRHTQLMVSTTTAPWPVNLHYIPLQFQASCQLTNHLVLLNSQFAYVSLEVLFNPSACIVPQVHTTGVCRKSLMPPKVRYTTFSHLKTRIHLCNILLSGWNSSFPEWTSNTPTTPTHTHTRTHAHIFLHAVTDRGVTSRQNTVMSCTCQTLTCPCQTLSRHVPAKACPCQTLSCHVPAKHCHVVSLLNTVMSCPCQTVTSCLCENTVMSCPCQITIAHLPKMLIAPHTHTHKYVTVATTLMTFENQRYKYLAIETHITIIPKRCLLINKMGTNNAI